MHRFYAPDIETSLMLPDEEAQHCLRVLRLGTGEQIEVTDGKGNLFCCTLTGTSPKRCTLDIGGKMHFEPHWRCRITIAIAPTKNMDRIEWMVEKATEMGVDRIIPIVCRYSERKVLKVDRLRKIAISAMKQSLKTMLPQVDDLTPVADVIRAPFEGQKFIAYCDDAVGRRVFVREYTPGSNVLVLVGPEGDFSSEEVAASITAGFVPVTFGESRLRTETAGVFACAAVHTLNQSHSK